MHHIIGLGTLIQDASGKFPKRIRSQITNEPIPMPNYRRLTIAGGTYFFTRLYLYHLRSLPQEVKRALFSILRIATNRQSSEPNRYSTISRSSERNFSRGIAQLVLAAVFLDYLFRRVRLRISPEYIYFCEN